MKLWEALTGIFTPKTVNNAIGDLFGGLFDSPKPKVEPVKAPDYQALWKTYAGQLQNINVNTNKDLGEIRARLSAAGASPDSIKQQTEFLEAQRVNKIGELEAGPTFAALKEGFEIAGGSRANPYDSSLPTIGPTKGAAGEPAEPGIAAKNLLDYYSQLYGGPETMGIEEAARRRAKQGAQGATSAASEVAASPWLTDKQTASFW